MAKHIVILFVGCMFVSSLCKATSTDIGTVNKKVKRYIRKTKVLQKEVDTLQTTVSTLEKDDCCTCTEFKSWQQQAMKNITKICEDFQTGMSEEIKEVKHHIERLDNKTDDHGEGPENVSTILDNLSTKQTKLEKENQALKDTLFEMQTEITKLQNLHSCGEGWRYFDGHCYRVVENPKTRDNASGYCENINSYLIEITTDAEREFGLIERFSGWTGAIYNDTEGNFMFPKSKQQVPEEYWMEGEPYGRDYNCVGMDNLNGELEFVTAGWDILFVKNQKERKHSGYINLLVILSTRA